MLQLRLGTISVIMLLFLPVAIGHSFTPAHTEAVMAANSEKVLKSYQEPSKKSIMIEDTRTKTFRGRKMGVSDNTVMEVKQVKVHFASVLPITLDYHLPRNHPPKHN